jgi:1-deoxy-D-xylulose 5-phosphate reductoisomerase
MKRSLVILGSTGSIGVQALEIVDANPDLFEVVAITAAGSNPDILIAQAKKYKVKTVGVIKNVDAIKKNVQFNYILSYYKYPCHFLHLPIPLAFPKFCFFH